MSNGPSTVGLLSDARPDLQPIEPTSCSHPIRRQKTISSRSVAIVGEPNQIQDRKVSCRDSAPFW